MQNRVPNSEDLFAPQMKSGIRNTSGTRKQEEAKAKVEEKTPFSALAFTLTSPVESPRFPAFNFRLATPLVSSQRSAYSPQLPVRSRFLPLYRPWITDDELQAVSLVLQNDRVRDCTSQLETDLAQYVAADQVIALSSSGAAVRLLLNALNIGPGDEVLISALAHWSMLQAVTAAGARPVLCDVEDDLTISPESAAHMLTLRSKALLCSHWGGHPCNMTELADLSRRAHVHLIEDATHALGGMDHSRFLGTFGIAGIYSFFPNDDFLTGEGAVVVTDDRRLAASIRQVASPPSGSVRDRPGSSITVLQAVHALHQIEKQELFLELRTRHADAYLKAISDLPFVAPRLRPRTRPAWHLLTLSALWEELPFSRQQFLARLHARNIGSAVLVQEWGVGRGSRDETSPFTPHPSPLPNARRLTEQVFSVPLYPSMTPDDVEDVVRALRDVLHSQGR